MKYLCLVYCDEREWDALSRREYEAMVEEILAYREQFQQSGQVVVADALHYAQTATTLRVREGKVTITDGPFAEMKEQLGGFYLIEARDLNEAIRLAAMIPSARLGSVEVRPIKELAPRSPERDPWPGDHVDMRRAPSACHAAQRNESRDGR